MSPALLPSVPNTQFGNGLRLRIRIRIGFGVRAKVKPRSVMDIKSQGVQLPSHLSHLEKKLFRVASLLVDGLVYHNQSAYSRKEARCSLSTVTDGASGLQVSAPLLLSGGFWSCPALRVQSSTSTKQQTVSKLYRFLLFLISLAVIGDGQCGFYAEFRISNRG